VSTPYEEIKALHGSLNEGVRRAERWTMEGERGLLAMARANDPFYAGQDWQRERAEWFASLFRRLGFEGRRVHLRFVHYVASGEEPNPATGEKREERLPDGRLYENTEENWNFIQAASKDARNMELVDPSSIIDRRTPRPFLFAPENAAPDPYVEVDQPTLELPAIRIESLEPYRSDGTASARGYSRHPAHEPSLVEVWIEKNLDDDADPLIETLCRELNVTLVTGIGFMTISSVHALLGRRARLQKPLRILYLSDFDPAGKHMPVSPARHIEFALRSISEDQKSDIRLHHLALTEEQVRDLGLPRIPIKDSDRRKANFEARHGQGAVELNALMHETRVEETEAMLRGAILRLRDRSLPQKRIAAYREAQEIVDDELELRLRWAHRALTLIEERAREIGERYATELEDIQERLSREIAPLEERAERVLHAARRRLEGLEEDVAPLLPTVEGEEMDGAAEGWLFDSRRDYMEQLRHYKNR
jgi:hypothetical protein